MIDLRGSTVLALALILTSACVSRQAVNTEVPIPQTRFSQTGGKEVERDWWRAFDSAYLDELVERGLRNNHELGQAWARLAQAQAVHRVGMAERSPQLNLSSGRQQRVDLSEDVPDRKTAELGLNLSYQVDLWGKIAASSRASARDLHATRQDVASTALLVSGQITNIWLDLMGARRTSALLQQQEAVNRNYLRLVEARFAQGLASGTEVSQQRLQLASVINRQPALQARIEQNEHALAILLGENPLDYSFTQWEALPELPELPDTGIPAQLLDRRPDVQAAAQRLFAADERLLAARLARYPRLDLSASTTASGGSLSTALDQWAMNLGANLLMPLIDGGARKAEVARNEAVTEERLLGWKKAVLQAVGEVEDALAVEQYQRRTLAGLRKQSELAGQTLDSARKNYSAGVSDYLNVLTALQSLHNLEIETVYSQQTLLANRVALYLALAGDVVSDVDKMAFSEEQP